MKADRRKIWHYKGKKVVPISCQDPTWGKCGEPLDFGDGIQRNRFWRVDKSDEQMFVAPTKAAMRRAIDAEDGK